MEGDFFTRTCTKMQNAFQSTPSVWRVTRVTERELDFYIISIHTLRMEGDAIETAFKKICNGISIHTLRMEGDSHRIQWETLRAYFNPHPPYGG